MSKSQLILKLYARYEHTMSYKQVQKFIADKLATSEAYVRTVARQRKGRSASEAEMRYLKSPLGLKTRRDIARNAFRKRYWFDEAWREEYKRKRRERYQRSKKAAKK